MPAIPQNALVALLIACAALLGVITYSNATNAQQRAFSETNPFSAYDAELLAAPTSSYEDGSLAVQPAATGSAQNESSLVSNGVEKQPVETVQRRGGVECEKPHLVVTIPHDRAIFSRPGGKKIATMPSRSIYLKESMRAWIQQVSSDGKWGKVTVPWGSNVKQSGWIRLAGLPQTSTKTLIVGRLSTNQLYVYSGCKQVIKVPMASGAGSSPSPTGRFWITERVAVPANQPYFGSFAFGMSTIQPNPPAGWKGGNQMAIHGTNDPASIGTASSAGCLRVDEPALDQLKKIVDLGTPVVITR